MALSRKEPTVKAKFSISSWALQLSQPFIQLISSCSCSGSAVPPTVPLVTISVCVEGGKLDHRVEAGIPKDQRDRCTFRRHWKCQGWLWLPQAGLAIHLAQDPWSGNAETLVFLEVTNPLESPIKEAMFLLLRKCTQRLAHSFGVSCVPCMSPRVGFPF